MVRIRALCRGLFRFGPCMVALVVAPRSARAEQSPLPFRVEYQPGDGCAPEEQFSEQLLARTRRVQRAQPGEAALRYRIVFSGSRDALIGHFTVIELDGSETGRDIPSAPCSEMVAGMALIAAVLVDPNAIAPAPVTPAPVTPAPVTPAPVTPAPVTPAPPLITPPKTENRSAESASKSGQNWVFAAGAGALLADAVAPSPQLGISVEVGAKLETQQPLNPWFALAFMQTLKDREKTLQGTAVFDWWALRLTASPTRWPSNGPIALRPAMLLDVGRLNVSGENAFQPDSTKVTWLALGALLRLEISPVRALALAFDGGLVVPMQHDSFYFVPEPALFTIPRLGFTARFGLAAQF